VPVARPPVSFPVPLPDPVFVSRSLSMTARLPRGRNLTRLICKASNKRRGVLREQDARAVAALIHAVRIRAYEQRRSSDETRARAR